MDATAYEIPAESVRSHVITESDYNEIIRELDGIYHDNGESNADVNQTISDVIDGIYRDIVRGDVEAPGYGLGNERVYHNCLGEAVAYFVRTGRNVYAKFRSIIERYSDVIGNCVDDGGIYDGGLFDVFDDDLAYCKSLIEIDEDAFPDSEDHAVFEEAVESELAEAEYRREVFAEIARPSEAEESLAVRPGVTCRREGDSWTVTCDEAAQAEILRRFPRCGNLTGVYSSEDVERAYLVLAFAADFAASGAFSEGIVEECEGVLRDHFPGDYERYSGHFLWRGESRAKDRQIFLQMDNESSYVVEKEIGDFGSGWTVVSAVTGRAAYRVEQGKRLTNKDRAGRRFFLIRNEDLRFRRERAAYLGIDGCVAIGARDYEIAGGLDGLKALQAQLEAAGHHLARIAPETMSDRAWDARTPGQMICVTAHDDCYVEDIDMAGVAIRPAKIVRQESLLDLIYG